MGACTRCSASSGAQPSCDAVFRQQQSTAMARSQQSKIAQIEWQQFPQQISVLFEAVGQQGNGVTICESKLVKISRVFAEGQHAFGFRKSRSLGQPWPTIGNCHAPSQQIRHPNQRSSIIAGTEKYQPLRRQYGFNKNFPRLISNAMETVFASPAALASEANIEMSPHRDQRSQKSIVPSTPRITRAKRKL